MQRRLRQPSFSYKLVFPFLSKSHFNVLTIVKLHLKIPFFQESSKQNQYIDTFLSHIYLVVVPQVEKFPANNEKIKQHNEGKA